MFKKIIDKFNKLEKNIKKIMKYGFIFSFIICILSSIILFTYEIFYAIPDLYYIGLSLFKLSLSFTVSFIICGFATDRIKKEII